MKLAVVSPQVLFRKTLCAYLTISGTFANILEFDCISDLVDSSDRSQSLVLIVHISHPADGIDSLNQLRQLFPEIRVLLLTDALDEEFDAQALESGAFGCLTTSETPQVLVKAVERVADGERWFAARVTNAVLDKLIAGRRSKTIVASNLTPREWEVLTLVAQGQSDKEVASSLFISRETAKSHVKSIYKKLQVSTRREAAVCYFKHIGSKTNFSNRAHDNVMSPGPV